MVVDLSNVHLDELAAALADVDFGGFKGVNVADPTLDQHVATKKYHDDNKYSDAEAVAACDASNIFIERNKINIITADTEIKTQSLARPLKLTAEIASQIVISTLLRSEAKSTTSPYLSMHGQVDFPQAHVTGIDQSVLIGGIIFLKRLGAIASEIDFHVVNTTPSTRYPLKLAHDKITVDNIPIKNIKNHADATLSGTPRIIELLIDTTPYFFKVYPTKT